jgi:hypothetical protein
MADITPENEFSLENMQELHALSVSDCYYLRNFCPDPNEVIQRFCNEASEVTKEHFEHLLEWERRLGDYCYQQISSSPRALECSMQEVTYCKHQIAKLCGLPPEEYQRRAPHIGKSLSQSFNIFLNAPKHKILRIFTKWTNKRRRQDEELRISFEKLRKREAHLAEGGKLKERRNALIRSHKIAQMIMGKPAVDDFIETNEAKIQGVLYNYIVKRKSKTLLSTGGHGQTVLTVCTLSGEEICDLCIYSKDCTLLDHVVGIFTRIKAGEELTILETGNVFNVREGKKDEANEITILKHGKPLDDRLDGGVREEFLDILNRSLTSMDSIMEKLEIERIEKRKIRKIHLRDFMKNHFTARHITAVSKDIIEGICSIDMTTNVVSRIIENPFALGPQQIMAASHPVSVQGMPRRELRRVG